jgi:hypothetical protein
MQLRTISGEFHRTLCKIVGNPTFKVVLALIVMAVAAWIVVQTEIDLRHSAADPLVFAPK